MSSLLIRGGNLVTAGGVVKADLLVRDGRIAAIGQNLQDQSDQQIDGRGKLVLPGGVDAHVHLPWPTGSVISQDDFASGTKAAACGGVTTVLDFAIPNDDESLTAALERKLIEAKANAWVDFSFHLNVRGDVERKLAEIPGLVERGFPSFKIFMAYEGFRLNDADLLQVMGVVASSGGMIGVHAEDGILADHLTSQLVRNGHTALSNYPQARPPACEQEAIHRVLTYARTLGTRVHIHHVSTAAGAQMIGRAQGEGLAVTAETCPQYLLFNDQDYCGDPRKAAGLVCAPPVKSLSDQGALWQALTDDTLSVLATDHCPYSKQQKYACIDDFTRVPGGVPGVETRLPLIYTEGVVKGKLSLSRFVEIWATGPARAFGLYPRKGVIAAGSDADLVLVDPERRDELHAASLHMNTDCLPTEGWPVSGWPVTTILRGHVVVQDGNLIDDKPTGELVRRQL